MISHTRLPREQPNTSPSRFRRVDTRLGRHDRPKDISYNPFRVPKIWEHREQKQNANDVRDTGLVTPLNRPWVTTFSVAFRSCSVQKFRSSEVQQKHQLQPLELRLL